MTTIKPVRKAVFPVAGMGTRFLPATKAIPKGNIYCPSQMNEGGFRYVSVGRS